MQLISKLALAMVVFLGLGLAFTACKNEQEPAPVLGITSISPTTAPINSTVAITGTQFGSTPASNTVTFGGNAVAEIVTASTTQLVVRVPANAQNGTISVTTGGQTISSSQTFSLGNRPVINKSGNITASETWTSDNIYLIQGFLYVKSGATLTIQPGTIIKGADASADPTGQQKGGTLIIEAGAKIEARGTATNPIVFTSNKAAGQRKHGDWGGIVIIGRAPHNRPGSTAFEGGISGQLGTFNEPADNSGTFQYVRIEFPGIALTPNNEINGLTLYGVGSGTTMSHIQISYSGDDAFEWFGGTVDMKNLVTLRTWDDDFDADWGYTGRVQYGVALRDPNVADQSGSNAFETDNFGGNGQAATPAANNGLPQTAPVFANFSAFAFSGTPSNAPTSGGSGAYQSAIHHRRNSNLALFNSVFAGFPEGIRLDNGQSGTPAVNGTGTSQLITNNTLQLRGIVLANTEIPGSTTAVRGAAGITNAQAQTYFSTAAFANQVIPSTQVATLLLNAQSFNLTAPAFTLGTGSPLLTGAVWDGKGADAFFTKEPFRGAFGTTNWTAGWVNWDPQNTPYN
jgi:hypothetical protein